MKDTLLLFISILFLSSCEKTVEFELDDSEPKLVVEATIENNKPPTVVLTTSLNYFSEISAEILNNSFVRNASVFVSNGTLTHKLKEYSIPLGNGYIFYYYSVDSSSLSSAFTGQLNTKYSLKINWQGRDYTATTTIPFITKRIDSLYWNPASGSADSNKVALMAKVTDPPGYGDYIRYFTKQNSDPVYPGHNSVFDDQIIDGTTYTTQVERGTNRSEESYDDEVFFEKGDTATLKLCNIDKATFDFWRTMEFSYSSVGNPFSSPTKVLGNISNGALGYFGGYAAQFRTIIIPR
jgi:Domain of unknown function (DUF4249)